MTQMTDPEATAARLRALGCTAEQVALHLKRLAAIAKKRQPPPPPRKPPPMPALTDDQLRMVLSQLATGSFVRFRSKHLC